MTGMVDDKFLISIIITWKFYLKIQFWFSELHYMCNIYDMEPWSQHHLEYCTSKPCTGDLKTLAQEMQPWRWCWRHLFNQSHGILRCNSCISCALCFTFMLFHFIQMIKVSALCFTFMLQNLTVMLQNKRHLTVTQEW